MFREGFKVALFFKFVGWFWVFFVFFSFPALESIATICKRQGPLADKFTSTGHSRTEDMVGSPG